MKKNTVYSPNSYYEVVCFSKCVVSKVLFSGLWVGDGCVGKKMMKGKRKKEGGGKEVI